MSAINKKIFNVIVNNSKSFTISIFGFGISTSLFARIIVPSIRIATIILIGLGLHLSLIIKKIKFTFNNNLIKLRTKFILSLRLRKIILTISAIKLTTKWTQTISARKVILGLLMKIRMRIVGTIIRIPKLALSMSILVGTFTKLSVYDPQMLSVLDSKTLQEMDITFG